jgi:hypothetical protein
LLIYVRQLLSVANRPLSVATRQLVQVQLYRGSRGFSYVETAEGSAGQALAKRGGLRQQGRSNVYIDVPISSGR